MPRGGSLRARARSWRASSWVPAPEWRNGRKGRTSTSSGHGRYWRGAWPCIQACLAMGSRSPLPFRARCYATFPGCQKVGGPFRCNRQDIGGAGGCGCLAGKDCIGIQVLRTRSRYAGVSQECPEVASATHRSRGHRQVKKPLSPIRVRHHGSTPLHPSAGPRQEPLGQNRPTAFTLCYKVGGPSALPPRFEPVDPMERDGND